MFIMNFKEIHSNTEFLSTYRRAREIPLTGEMSRSDKRVCRIADLLLPKLNQITVFIEKRLERNVQATFGTFRLLRVGSTHVQLHSQKTKFISLSRSLTLLIFNLGGN